MKKSSHNMKKVPLLLQILGSHRFIDKGTYMEMDNAWTLLKYFLCFIRFMSHPVEIDDLMIVI